MWLVLHFHVCFYILKNWICTYSLKGRHCFKQNETLMPFWDVSDNRLIWGILIVNISSTQNFRIEGGMFPNWNNSLLCITSLEILYNTKK
jgi:hypothetical protein